MFMSIRPMLHYNRHEKVANFKIVRKSNQKPDFLFLIFLYIKLVARL